MEFEELIAKLKQAKEGKLEDVDTVIEGITDIVEKEKNKGIKLTRKKDKELLKYKSYLKELGYSSDEYTDANEFVSTIKNKIKTPTEPPKGKIAELNDKLNNVVEQLESERKKSEKLREVNTKEKIVNTLMTSDIGKKLYGSKYVIDSLINNNRVAVDSNNSVYFKSDSDDEPISFDKGIKQILEENKEMLKSTQNTGTGEPGGDHHIDKELSEMSTKEALANIDDIKKQMGLV